MHLDTLEFLRRFPLLFAQKLQWKTHLSIGKFSFADCICPALMYIESANMLPTVSSISRICPIFCCVYCGSSCLASGSITISTFCQVMCRKLTFFQLSFYSFFKRRRKFKRIFFSYYYHFCAVLNSRIPKMVKVLKTQEFSFKLFQKLHYSTFNICRS